MRLIKYILIVALSFFSTMTWVTTAFAEESPLVTMETTANNVVKELQENKSKLKQDPELIYRIVQKNLIPLIDIRGMSRSVLERDVWRDATTEQRQNFSEAFTRLVVRTYSGALADYTSETITFSPLREDFTKENRLMVYSTINRKQGPSIPLSYRLIRTPEGWRVYDMSVEGVSLLQSFRAQFTSQLQQGDLNTLIAKLGTLNAKRI